MHKEILTYVVIDFADIVALNLYMSQRYIMAVAGEVTATKS